MHRWLIGVAVAVLTASPALAQQKAPGLSMAGALKQGYEIKSVAGFSSVDSKAIWSNEEPQTVVTFQKGTSLLICVLATANWSNALPDRFANPNLCQAYDAATAP
ncbi:MAG TPA: hypothetical protein VGF92_19140 [Stellaceae bacterium]|jgi:hypothetical protein